ncbi:MAG: Uma2 family endonuclease [Acidobacteria bacterium]|nr:MAG: Uma2 family endonuclease [Acidobacteriota bacterium]
MEAEVKKRLFTVEEYHQMAEAGILREDDRVELIDGEIIQMSPIGHRHMVCVNRANTLFIQAFGNGAVVSPQNPVRLTDWTEPQPDLVVFKPRADFYAKKEPVPEDVLFMVEIAETTLSYDRKIKLPRYAAAGIPEFWIGDLKNDILHVYRNPGRETYNIALILHPSESISPLAFPDVTFQVGELLSIDCEKLPPRSGIQP